MNPTAEKVVILGAAGRDFHNYLRWFRDRPEYEVVAFTAEQIPGIAGRRFPAALAGPRHPEGIPIVPESALAGLLVAHDVRWVHLAYSDLSHQAVMEKASLALAHGARFLLLPGRDTWVSSSQPVIAVTAVRTGCGKSQTARAVAEGLRARGRRPVAVRHSMPYGSDLTRQTCQRFVAVDDFARHQTTIEEEEEYQPWLDHGFPVFAGFDYREIVRQAEGAGDVLVFDGGNNDLPMIRPDVQIVVLDPHRAGHETTWYPGFANLLAADLVVINKVDSAEPAAVAAVEAAARKHRPGVPVIRARSILLGDGAAVRGKRCVVIGDGPTLTHGGMAFGAGSLFVRRHGGTIVDPRPHLVGALRDTLVAHPHIAGEVPAMGYSKDQLRDLEASVNAVPAEVVVDGSPADLGRVLRVAKPIVNVRYELDDDARGQIAAALGALGVS